MITLGKLGSFSADHSLRDVRVCAVNRENHGQLALPTAPAVQPCVPMRKLRPHWMACADVSNGIAFWCKKVFLPRGSLVGKIAEAQ